MDVLLAMWYLILAALTRCATAQFPSEPRVAQVCQGGQLRLTCAGGRVIEVMSVQLADSRCLDAIRGCCPRPNDCAVAASTRHQTLAMNRCNGQRSCSLSTERRKIPCGHFGFWVNNDYERITYHCIEISTIATKPSTTWSTPTSTTTSTTTTTTTAAAAAAADDDDNGWLVTSSYTDAALTSLKPADAVTDVDAATSTNNKLLVVQHATAAESSAILSHTGIPMTTTQLLVAGGVMIALMFSAFVCVNVCLCRRLHRSHHRHQYHPHPHPPHHHHQQQQQQQQQEQCGAMTSVELMSSGTCHMQSHHYSPTPTATAPIAAAPAADVGLSTDAGRASPVSFCKPSTSSDDADALRCEENHYEDIDIYLVPVTDRMYQNGDV